MNAEVIKMVLKSTCNERINFLLVFQKGSVYFMNPSLRAKTKL